MATDASFIEYVAEQADCGPALSWKRMFGEYALYLDGKVIAFVCDNMVYMKPTEAARTELGTVTEAPAYPGSKMYYRLGDELDDRALHQRLFRATRPGAAAAQAQGRSQAETDAEAQPRAEEEAGLRSPARSRSPPQPHRIADIQRSEDTPF